MTGAELRALRVKSGMTQPQMVGLIRAVIPQMDVGLYSKIEHGYCLLTPEAETAIKSGLQVGVESEYEKVDKRDAENKNAVQGKNADKLRTVVPAGKANAVPRSELASRLGMRDREMRELIEAARGEGLIVINDSDGKGYYLPEGLDDIRRQYRHELARMKSLYRATKPMRDALKAAGEAVR